MKVNTIVKNTRVSFALVRKDVSDLKLALARLSSEIERVREDQRKLVDKIEQRK